MRILIVEDEYLIALEIEMILEDLGHEIVGIADNLAEARALAESLVPDLVTIDLRLRHGEGGDDLARELLQRHGLRALFISGNLDAATRKRLNALRPHGFLDKPLSGPLLAKALELVDLA